MALVIGCVGKDAVQGSGKQKTEIRNIAPFNAIYVRGNQPFLFAFCSQHAQISVKHAKRPSLAITTDDNLLPLIKNASHGHQLTIDLPMRVKTNIGIKLELSTPPVYVYNATKKRYEKSTTTMANGCTGFEWELN